jgi:transmembrane sensor
MVDTAQDRIRARDDAEAAAWLTRLHGPDRTPELERELQVWLKEPAHAAAFEEASAMWDKIPGVSAAIAFRARRKISNPTHSKAFIGGVAFGCLVVALLSWMLVSREPGYQTETGEQRSLTLADGTRVLLNTRSHVVPRYSASGPRIVDLVSGEALFEVAKDPLRPFVVDAGSKRVVALGTIFSVRKDGSTIEVTLLEGRVAVSDKETAVTAGLTLMPGQRVRAAGQDAPVMDSPNIELVTAWKNGKVVFDDATLAEAVAEMNRYSLTPIDIADGDIKELKVSGIFRAGDVEAFAKAISAVHGLSYSKSGDHIALAARI